MRALDMLAIYEDSKTYIVDETLENIVAQMRAIVRKDNPYKDIPKLPELREQFTAAYMKVLQVEEAPVLDSIDQARSRVLEVLDTKEYRDTKRQRYMDLFGEIRDGAEKCNNVSSLRSFADKAEALKLRLLNEMDQMDMQIAKKKAEEERKRLEEEVKKNGIKTPTVIAEPKPEYKVRKTKNVSIKSMTRTSSWRLESEEDIDKYVEALRQTLKKELDKDTILNIEF